MTAPKASRGMPTIAARTRANALPRTAARHDEAPTENGCIFAAAVLVAIAVIIFVGMLA